MPDKWNLATATDASANFYPAVKFLKSTQQRRQLPLAMARSIGDGPTLPPTHPHTHTPTHTHTRTHGHTEHNNRKESRGNEVAHC